MAPTSVTLLDDDQDVTLSFKEYRPNDLSNFPLVTSTSVSEMDADDQEQEVVVFVRALEAPRNAMDVPISVTRNRSRYSVTGDMTIEISAGEFIGKTTLKVSPVDNDRYDADADITVSVGGGLQARTVKITVRDMDETEPKLKITASPDKVHESGSDNQIVQVTAELDGDAVQTATKVAITVTADSDVDRYSVSGTKSITIPAGRKSGTTNLSFSPTKDAIYYDDLDIMVNGSSDYGDASDAVMLRDNDQEVTLSVSPSSVMEKADEDDANVPQKVTITATLPSSKPKAYAVPLDVAVSANNRYTLDPADGEVTITIDAGKATGTAEVTITPNNNISYNKDEDIMVSVSTADNRDNSGLAARPVAIKLTDDEKSRRSRSRWMKLPCLKLKPETRL